MGGEELASNAEMSEQLTGEDAFQQSSFQLKGRPLLVQLARGKPDKNKKKSGLGL